MPSITLNRKEFDKLLGKKIPEEDANTLISAAQEIIELLSDG